MQRLLLSLLMLSGAATAASHGPAETPLSAAERQRLEGVMAEALRDADITPQTYRQSLAWLHATPCQGVDRTLSSKQAQRLGAALARQQRVPSVTVHETFVFKGWSAVNASTDSDGTYFLYRSPPSGGAAPVTRWSGGATFFETTDIAHWFRTAAPGIPSRLADCLAWHITFNQEDDFNAPP